jgi:3-phenylpropionate/trans-cinnamate dioxygenase ferredoxin subunit
MELSDWTYAAEVDAVTEETPISAQVGDVPVGVYRIGGVLHAIEDICPHADALLTEGFVDGEYVECPLHGALFHVPTGKCTQGPAARDLMLFDTCVEGKKIYLRKHL